MTERLRVLDELEKEFAAVAARAGRPLGRRVLRPVAVSLVGLLLAAGVAAAASYIATGSPIPGAADSDLPMDARIAPGSSKLAGAEARDPVDGRPAWDLRVSRSATGELCTAVGQVVDGRFGLVGLDGVFRKLPLQGVDACGSDPVGRPAFVGARVFAADRPEEVRTVINGVGADGLDDVTVTSRGRRIDVSRGDGGTFVAVLQGPVEQVQPTVKLRFAGGGPAKEYRFGQSRYAVAPDPAGDGEWTVRAHGRPGNGLLCAQAQQTRLAGMTPPVCGRLADDHVFFEVRGFARTRRPTPYMWTADARTLVWGAADETIADIEVRVGGRTYRAARAPKADEGFVAVLPAGTRPADVEVTVVSVGGERARYVGGQNLRRADGTAREAPLREPPAARAGSQSGPVAKPDPTSVTITHVQDLADGRVALRAYDSGRERCVEFGWLSSRGEFGSRRRGGRVVPQPPGAVGPVCNPRGAARPNYRWAQVLDDGSVHDPRVIGTVAYGHAGARAARVVAKDIDTAANASEDGTFLVVSPSRARPTSGVALDISRSDGKSESTRNPGFRPAPVVQGSIEVVARAPDPDGRQPWGLLRWATDGGGECTTAGAVVGDMVGGVSARDGLFSPYPVHEGGACGKTADDRGGFPVGFSVSSGIGGHGPEDDDVARRERRTLPGRTWISGRLDAGVTRVTVQTPRDVRSFRRTGDGAFLIVYDGRFTTGTITVTAELGDGTQVRRELDLEG